MYTKFWLRNLKRRYSLGGVGGRIILKWMFDKLCDDDDCIKMVQNMAILVGFWNTMISISFP
jgi:hypothetical protein